MLRKLALLLVFLAIAVAGCFVSGSPDVAAINALLDQLEAGNLAGDANAVAACYVPWLQNQVRENARIFFESNGYTAYKLSNRVISGGSYRATATCVKEATLWNIYGRQDIREAAIFSLCATAAGWKIESEKNQPIMP